MTASSPCRSANSKRNLFIAFTINCVYYTFIRLDMFEHISSGTMKPIIFGIIKNHTPAGFDIEFIEYIKTNMKKSRQNPAGIFFYIRGLLPQFLLNAGLQA